MPSHPAVELDSVARCFSGRPALVALSVSIEAGEILALQGPNGAGKTTALRILASLLLPSAGRVRVLGFCPATEPREVRRRIGWVPAQDRGFFPRLTGRENLQLFGALSGQDARRTEDAIARLSAFPGMPDALASPFATASTGMRQKLRVARALLHDPEVLLLDEPTRSLDPQAAHELRQLIHGSGKTVCLATHSADEAAELGARTVWVRPPC
jgi:ABC-2 type transport system ATP-binding protein